MAYNKSIAINSRGVTESNLPGKMISRLGCMNCSFCGRKTNGMFSTTDPLTKGANVHSANEREIKETVGQQIYWKETRAIKLLSIKQFQSSSQVLPFRNTDPK